MTEQDTQDTFVLKKKNIFIWSVLLIGWLFDFLFWEKEPGISIPIFLLILAVGGFWLSRQQLLTPARTISWLLIPVGFFGIMSVVRFEPMTTFLNIAGAFALLAILAHSITAIRMLRSDAGRLPAMSKAVPCPGDVLTHGMPSVTFITSPWPISLSGIMP